MIVLRDLFIYLILRLLAATFLIFSYPGALRFGVAITRRLFPLFPKYRRIALENIARAFPEKDETWHNAVLKGHIAHLGRLLADVCWKPRMNQRWMDRYIRYEDRSREIENDILARSAEGKGTILVSGHIGTWENISQFGGFVYRGAAIYKAARNRFVDRWIFRLRTLTGTAFLPMDATQTVLKQLKAGRVVMMAADQNAGGAGIPVEFLHRPASTYRGPAFLSLLTKVPLVFVAMLHGQNGDLHLYMEELGPVDAALFPSHEDAIRAGTESWVHRLEEYIRRYPEQYFWVHRRWKTTPEMLERLKAERIGNDRRQAGE